MTNLKFKNNNLFSIKNFRFKTSKIIRAIISFVFPPRCAGCNDYGIFLCENCLRRLPPAEERRDENIISVFSYDNAVVKKIVWLLKYRGVFDLAEILGQALYETAVSELADELAFDLAASVGSRGRFTAPKILVIPAPLSKKRLAERGFNQAEELAKHFVANDPANFLLATDLVIKIKETKTQVSVHRRADRLANLHGAFEIARNYAEQTPNKTLTTKILPQNFGGHPKAPKKLKRRKFLTGRTAIIIDDVSTTGATIGEITKILRRAGARRIFGLVVAHG